MKPEEVRKYPPVVLTEAERELYFENGYLLLERFVDHEWLARLRAATNEFLERSRQETRSGDVYDLAPGHGPAQPRLRRLKSPDDQHEAFWEYARGVMADLARDLVGPDVVFHHAKLNFKWNDGNDEVDWHQDIQFYPHTNYSSLTIGTYLYDTGPEDGPLGVLPRSHEGPLYDLYDAAGNWAGSLQPPDVAKLPVAKLASLEGPAGSVTIHNCRTVHSSPPSRAAGGRPLLLNSYTSADAKAYMPHPQPSSHAYAVVRGKPARWASHDPRPCPLPPDWSGGYTSIFAAQAGEQGRGSRGE